MPTVYSPPVETYIALADITLAADTSTVVLSGFSQDYRDLIVVINGGNTAGGNTTVRLNGDTTSSYSYVYMFGNGTSALSGAGSNDKMQGSGMNNNLNNMSIFTLFDFSATDKHKVGIFRDGTGEGFTGAWANRWASTDAVTSLTVGTNSGDLKSGTTLRLFGIEA